MAHKDQLSRFDNHDNFIYHPDMRDGDIPCEAVTPEKLGLPSRPKEYVMVHQTSWHLFPPVARLLLGILHSHRVFGPDSDGWVSVSASLADRTGLVDKHARSRALRSLEKLDGVEVLRRPGKATKVRLLDLGSP